MPFVPGDPWPGTAGGAARDEWSGYVRIYLQAQVAAGTPFVMGPDAADRLNAGNVMWQVDTLELEGAPRAGAPASGLWVDLSCDLIDMEISLGSSAGAGILSKSEAAVLSASLYDPDGRYDPLNPETPFALAGRTRLTPGVPVCCWAEVINNPNLATPGVLRYPLFTGTADRWMQAWTNEPSDRVAQLLASDSTKIFTRFDLPALPAPVGQGDTVLTRLGRITANYGWTGTVQSFGNCVATLQSTTLAQSAWELVNRVADDELGFLYFLPALTTASGPQVLAIVAREVWNQRPAPSITIGCGAGMYDIATDVQPASFDEQLRNAVYAARTGGTQQVVLSSASIARYWQQSLDRSDLGLADDAQVGAWANALVQLGAYPQTGIDQLTLRPDVAAKPWDAWELVLGKALITGLIRVLWNRAGYTVDTQARLVGWTHRISADEWSVEWRTVNASVSSSAGTLHMGPHAQDQLDAGLVMA
jgi:hypothetical protein